jgi:pSer/pThr/pTyr-binding forkhead associated (FHA) protein
VLAGSGVVPRHALLQTQADGQVIIRKAVPAAEVLINGVRLGAEPTPLLHGDKVDIGGNELTFVDERRTGSTQFLQMVKPSESGAPAKAPSPVARTGAATGNSGGRIISLTDGREYVIAGKSLVFGREAVCDVVVGGKDVSRRHAEIMQAPNGYVLLDASTNGTFVNEERVQGQRVLTRADVIRIGEESFRFYADVVASPPPAPAAPQPPSAPSPPPVPPPAVPLPTAAPGGASAQPRPLQGAALATLLVRSGSLKGQRFQLRTPVVNVGRADYNDVPLADPSVSTAHAKLQRREGVWVLVDLDSTNGSSVDGERVKGEAPVAPGASIRFGDVELLFEPTDDALGVAKGGGTTVMPSSASAAPPRAPAKPAAAKPSAPKAAPARKRPQASAPAAKKGKGCGAGVIVLAGAVGGVAALIRWILA